MVSRLIDITEQGTELPEIAVANLVRVLGGGGPRWGVCRLMVGSYADLYCTASSPPRVAAEFGWIGFVAALCRKSIQGDSPQPASWD